MIETEVHFENHKRVIEEELAKAKFSVHIAVAWINFKSYFQIFCTIIKNGAKLNVVCSDNWQNRSHQKEIDELASKGASIRLLKMPSLKNHMHHKFAIIDSETIINGSFNWSPNAENSMENLMVIRDATDDVKKFLNEFQRLLTIESETIKNLQTKIKCPNKGCDGNLYNVLVFSERSTKYFETFGDIVSVCNECYEYSQVEECIPNKQIEILLSELRSASDDYDYELIDKHLSDLLLSYQNNDSIIHAIGKVKTTVDGYDEECVSTIILWKNKFVGDNLLDEFENEDFDVLYDN
jgi:hypothetical protein